MHLEWRGLYDGVSILRDDETGTLWHHITGEGLYGPLAGKRLGTPSNLLHSTVEVALEMYPDIDIAISDRPLVRENRWAPLLGRIPVLGRGLRATMAREDERLPTMEIGLGIWVGDSTAQFYPMAAINAAGDALVDAFEGRQVVVYFDPRSRSLQAAYVDATSAWWEDEVLLTDNGYAMSGGYFLDADGQRVAVERPLQQFTRWYGWALTFPGTEIWSP